jgi:pyruvate/oxaloacetate carboxyltransferase
VICWRSTSQLSVVRGSKSPSRAPGSANTLAAIDAGARQVDARTRRMSAGAGNPAAEAFVAVLERLGIATGIDVEAMADAAKAVVGR